MNIIGRSEKIAQNDPLLQNECDSKQYLSILMTSMMEVYGENS